MKKYSGSGANKHLWWYIGGVAKNNEGKIATNLYSTYMREMMAFSSTNFNTKKTQFLPVAENIIGIDTDATNGRLMLDPWGNQYVIAIYDYAGSGASVRKNPRIYMPKYNPGTGADTNQQYFGELFIMSKGADGQMAISGNDGYNKDNITSWKE